MKALKTYVYDAGVITPCTKDAVPALCPLMDLESGTLKASSYFVHWDDPRTADIIIFPNYLDRYLESFQTIWE